MSSTKTKISEKQKAIDKGWDLYNSAMNTAEELMNYLEDLADEYEVDTDKAGSAAYEAHSSLENAYSEGACILPSHSGDGGKA